MAMTFSRADIEDADLVIVVDSNGKYKYSSHRSDMEIIEWLLGFGRELLDQVRVERLKREGESDG